MAGNGAAATVLRVAPPGVLRTLTDKGAAVSTEVSQKGAGASRGEMESDFLVPSILDGNQRIRPIHLHRLLQGGAQIIEEFLSGETLGIHAWNLLDPAHPPLFTLLHYRREVYMHVAPWAQVKCVRTVAQPNQIRKALGGASSLTILAFTGEGPWAVAAEYTKTCPAPRPRATAC